MEALVNSIIIIYKDRGLPENALGAIIAAVIMVEEVNSCIVWHSRQYQPPPFFFQLVISLCNLREPFSSDSLF